MLLIKGARVVEPEGMAEKDILVGGGRILALEKNIRRPIRTACLVRAGGLLAMPGLIDHHLHLAGAGGEGGPHTRTPELSAADLISNGITTTISSLGADGFTRDPLNLLYKARSLNIYGLSSFILTGAYQFPLPSLSGDPYRDIILVPEVLGIGEVAIADHRSADPGVDRLYEMVARARLAGMVAGKTGMVLFHLGDEAQQFTKLREIKKRSAGKFRNIMATHCNRSAALFQAACSYGREGYVDLTTSSYPFFPEEEIKPSLAVSRLLAAGVPLEHITFSSDAGGSLPQFAPDGTLQAIFTAKPHSMLTELADLVLREKMDPCRAVRLTAGNAARAYGLPAKGEIRVGADADIILVNESFRLRSVVASGHLLLHQGKMLDTVKSTILS